jgi:hypothetical protein
MKYETFVIYIIEFDDSDLFYIGSTVNFKRRKFQHQKNTTNRRKKSYHRKLYKHIRLQGGWIKAKMSILETFPCESLDIGHNIEYDYIDQMKPELNTVKNINKKLNKEILL